MELERLQQAIGYNFKDASLLETALTHASSTGGGEGCNERLEFLGDAVLELVVSEYLYNEFAMREGEMSRVRAASVCEAALCKVAGEMSLAQYLRVGKSELVSGGREKPSIMADTLEAVIGAIFLDGGLEHARRFVLGFGREAVSQAVTGANKDSKTELQELLQSRGNPDIHYEVAAEEGPEHCKSFRVKVFDGGGELGEGMGGSKKEAEQAAAHCALNNLKK